MASFLNVHFVINDRLTMCLHQAMLGICDDLPNAVTILVIIGLRFSDQVLLVTEGMYGGTQDVLSFAVNGSIGENKHERVPRHKQSNVLRRIDRFCDILHHSPSVAVST